MEVVTLESEREVSGTTPNPAVNLRPGDVDATSFEQVYLSERAALMALALVLTGNRAVAEELTQETFLRLHEKWRRVSHYEDVAGWLRRVLLNLACSRGRRLAAETRALLRLRRERGAETVPAAWGDDFWAEVRALPRRQAQALVLYYLESRSVSEVAAILGCAEGTVRALLHQGRQTLKDRLHLVEEDSDDR